MLVSLNSNNQKILPVEVLHMTIQHPNAEGIRAKIQQLEDCFGVAYSTKDTACTKCTVLVQLAGDTVLQQLHNVCKLCTDPTVLPRVDSILQSMASTKPSKPIAPVGVTTSIDTAVLAAITAGVVTEPAITTHIGSPKATVVKSLKRLLATAKLNKSTGRPAVYSIKKG